MMRDTTHLIGLGVLLAGLAGGADVRSQTTRPAQVVRSETLEEVTGSALLDGMTFSGELGPLGKPADVQDTLVFADGTFVSTECDRRCGYPPAPYFVRRVEDKIEFTSESQCLHKDATLVWRGTVDDGTIKGRLRWSAHRWYWTIEKEFWFEGTLVKTAAPVASSQ